MQIRTFITILLCLYLAVTTLAQVNVKAALDTNVILIGEQVGLTLRIQSPPNTQLKDAAISVVSEVENLEVIRVSEWDTIAKSPQFILEKELLITSFDSGYYFIPAIPVQVVEYGLDKAYRTQQLALTVQTVPPADSIQLADIKDIFAEPRTWEDFIKPLTAIGLLLLLFAIAFYFWRNRKSPTAEIVQEVEQRSAHEIAIEQLQALRAAQLWQKGSVKEYQSRLTRVIREYLENRYEVNALESTTEQILQELKQVDFDSDWKDKLREMLQMADLVKFAKAEPPADFHGRMLDNAEAFVRATQAVKKIADEDDVPESAS